ncbi:hypothetical protein BaRGS_00018914, partial [Batillaria attramentaria]
AVRSQKLIIRGLSVDYSHSCMTKSVIPTDHGSLQIGFISSSERLACYLSAHLKFFSTRLLTLFKG